MREAKRFLASLLAVLLVAGSLPAGKSLAAAEGASGKMGESTKKLTKAVWDAQIYSTDYFGEQLTEEAEKVFYAALKTMYNSGAFVEGTVSYEIPVGNEEGMLQEELLNAYRDGDASLLQMFQNASNAFMLDRNDLFYVDWTKLSVRVGQKNGKWSVHVGNGAYKNLYLESAEYRDEAKVRTDIDKMNAKITEIADAAKKYKTREEQIGYVHDILITQIEYVYRGTTKIPGDTAAGGLVYGKAWCEGYARAFKAVMDKMDIPCVLVGGTGLPEAAQNGESLISPDVEAHMWNYVCMNDGKWYAMDVTYDDPITQKPGEAVRGDCLLKGAGEFSARHVESGQFSQGGRSFQYPVISEGNVGEGDENGESLKIDVSYYDAYNGGTWTSYTVMRPTYTLADGEQLSGKNIDGEGHYLYYKIRYEDNNGIKYTGYGDEWSSAKNLFEHSGDAAGLTTKAFCVAHEQGEKTITQVGYQFAIADKAPGNELASLNRLPEDATILDTSEVIYFRDRYQDIRTLRPSIIERKPDTFSYITESSTHIKYVYDMSLKLAEGCNKASMKVSTSLSGPTYRVENLTWKNTTRTGFNGNVSDCCEVEFDFYPDTSYNYSGTKYTFELDGLVSLANDSKPRTGSITWKSNNVNKYPCPYMPAPSEMLMSMYPRLSNTKYSPDLFTDPLGNGLAGTNNYDLNLTLIASKPSDGEQQKIEDALDGAGVQAAANTAVFSLDLSMGCLSMRTMLNSKLNEGKTKICMALPYPEGFDSRKLAGVTFEAYHFRKDENGNYVPEKLICNATDTGIWVIADSFSPFAVVAVDKAHHQADGKMISAVANAEMADISVTKNPSEREERLFPEVIELKEGESCTYTITPKDGYVLEQVIWNGAEQEVTAQEDGSYTVTYSWDELTEENNSLQVNFCAANVLEKEKTDGFAAQNPVSFTVGLANQNGQAVLTKAAGEDNFHAAQMEPGKTITAEMENISHVKLNVADLKMQKGTTSTLKLTEGSAENKWTSSHEEVATVDENGTVTAVSAGVSYITVTNANGAAMCKVEVTGESVAEVSEIRLSQTKISMKAGDAPVKLTVSILPENAANAAVNWSSSNANVATVDQNGKVTAVGAGSAVITAAAGGKTATCNVTVTAKDTAKNVQDASETRVTGVAAAPEKNDTIIKAGNYYYEIVSKKNRTVRVAGIKNKKQSKITICNQVKIGGQKYMVTSVAKNAFRNCVKAESVTVGKNVRVIGKSAFEGCRKLKKVTVKGSGLRQIQANAFKNCSKLTKIRIQSSKLGKVGKNAFRNVNKKAVIYVPTARYKKYVKLLKGKGMPKTVKIKK